MRTVRHGQFSKFFFSGLVEAWREEHNAYWLIDLFASHYAGNVEFRVALEADERLKDLQIWFVSPDGNGGCRVECRADTDDPVVASQDVEYTDFDWAKHKGKVKFYCAYTQVGDEFGYRMFLPEEY